MGGRSGLTMIEMILVMVLVGIVATVAGMFLFTGVTAYITTERNTDYALKAQVAMERISLELKDMRDRTVGGDVQIVDDLSVEYETTVTALPGVRRLRYVDADDAVYLRADTGQSDYVLINDVSNFAMNATLADMNGDGAADEIERVSVGITLEGLPTVFAVDVFPRNFVHRAP